VTKRHIDPVDPRNLVQTCQRDTPCSLRPVAVVMAGAISPAIARRLAVSHPGRLTRSRIGDQFVRDKPRMGREQPESANITLTKQKNCG
jgi:hypothetical protein